MRTFAVFVVGQLALLLAACAGGSHAERPSVSSRDHHVATLDDLQTRIEAASSATLALDGWCESRGMAPAGAVVADKIADELILPSPEIVQQLAVPAGEQVVMRHVRLRCGGHVLSEARLWYVPSRMPVAMFTALRSSDIAFGRAVAPLNFQRRSLGARRYYQDGALPAVLFDQRALLSLPDGRPLAYVQEDYLPGVLGVPAD